MFVGREEQFKQLKDLWRKPVGSLVTCRGRRRIGKSTLIAEFARRNRVSFIKLEGLPPREGVTNDEIREVYIDRYVDKNETIYDQLSSYKRVSKYTILTDLFLIFCEITLDKTRMKTIIDANGEHTMRLTLIESEVKEFMERLNTTDYIEEMECELEGL